MSDEKPRIMCDGGFKCLILDDLAHQRELVKVLAKALDEETEFDMDEWIKWAESQIKARAEKEGT